MVYQIREKRITFADLWIFVLDLFMSLCLYDFLELKLVVGCVMALIGLIRPLFAMRISNYGIQRFLFWFFVLWAYIFFNGFFVTDYYFSWRTQLIYLMPHMSVILYYSVGYTREELFEIFCKACKVACWICAVYILIVELPHFGEARYRLGSGVSNSNSVAMAFSMFFAVYLYERFYRQKKHTVQLVALVLLILLTGSKKGIVGIMVIVIALCLFKYRFKAYKYIVPIIFLLIIYWIINANEFLYSIIGRRIDVFFEDLSSDTGVGSTAQRMGMYEVGWNYFIQKPIWGYGYGFFTYNSGYGTYSHSNYIELLVSFGLVGTVFFYWFSLKLLSHGVKRMQTSEMAPLFLLLVIFNLIMQFMIINYYGTGFLYESLFFASALLLMPAEGET